MKITLKIDSKNEGLNSVTKPNKTYKFTNKKEARDFLSEQNYPSRYAVFNAKNIYLSDGEALLRKRV